MASPAVICKEKYIKERIVPLTLNAFGRLRTNNITVQRLVAGGEASSVTFREWGIYMLAVPPALFKFPAWESERSLRECLLCVFACVLVVCYMGINLSTQLYCGDSPSFRGIKPFLQKGGFCLLFPL